MPDTLAGSFLQLRPCSPYLKRYHYYLVHSISTSDPPVFRILFRSSPQGRTDECIRQWLTSRNVDRSEIILASKICGASERITWLPGRDGNGARVSKNQIVKSVEASLERLGTDYIDLIQIHWPDRYVPIFGSQSYDLEKEVIGLI